MRLAILNATFSGLRGTMKYSRRRGTFEMLIDEMSDVIPEHEESLRSPVRDQMYWLDLQPAEIPPAATPRNARYQPDLDPDTFDHSTDAGYVIAFTTNTEDIAKELGLGSILTSQDAAKRRRDFAQRNHPDCLPLALRDISTIRMQIANAILDAHLAYLRKD